MKKCIKCKQHKALQSYYLRKDSGLYRNECKKCWHSRCKLYRGRNKDRCLSLTADWIKKNKDRYLKLQKVAQNRYSKKYPQKVFAHGVARRYRAALMKECCETCGDIKKLEMHHPRYDKPLEVITLCSSCHRKETSRAKNTK